MSMAALLSHFGINTARYVTTTGEIVFAGVEKVGTVFSHATHGIVTPIAAHTFHDGVEPTDSETHLANWWDDPTALDRHIDAMVKAFPAFTYSPATEDHAPTWFGIIDTGRGKFNVRIATRHDNGLPSVTVLNHRLGAHAGKRWQKPDHVFINGNLCVASQDDWNPGDHTVATATGWAAHWLAAYTEWRMTRQWPIEGAHRVAS